jgi:ABC-type multidrug transport system fused ATPase/permease subunit
MTAFDKINYLLEKKEKTKILVLFFLILIGMAFEMISVGAVLPILNLVTNQDISKVFPKVLPILEQLGRYSRSSLIFYGILSLVLIYLIKSIFLVFLSWKQASFSTELSASLSRKLFLGYMKKPYSFHLKKNSALLLRNIQNETNLLMTVSISAINLSIEITVLVGITFTLIYLAPLATFLVGLFFGLAGFSFTLITKGRLYNWGKDRQYHDGNATQHILQGFGGIKEVKLMGLEHFFLFNFDKHNKLKAEVLTKQITFQQVPRIYLELLAIISLAGTVILTKSSSVSFEKLLPMLGVFGTAAFRVIPSVNRILSSIQIIRFNRSVIDLLHSEFQVINNSDVENIGFPKLTIKKLNDSIFVDRISFQYEGSETNALYDISMGIKKGEIIGLIGQSGSGKSTLVDIVLGLLRPKSGKILADGKDIYGNLRQWQNQIGYVPQSIYLTDESLRNNIAFGVPEDKINDLAVTRSVIAAQLGELIKSLPEGLNTIVGERGVRLSGGQRQRIGIARALYCDPDILVLDEATSALDSETEMGVIEAVNSFKGKKTILIIAHRLSTVQNCDRIYVLSHGKVVKNGTTDEILAQFSV